MAAKLVKVSVFLCVSWDYVTFASVKPETRHDYIYAVPVGTYCRIFYLWTLDGTDFRTRRPKDPGLDKGRRSGLYPVAYVEDFHDTVSQYRRARSYFWGNLVLLLIYGSYSEVSLPVLFMIILPECFH